MNKEKIKILEVNDIDLLGKSFNAYDLVQDFKDDFFIDIKQAVVIKKSLDYKVIKLLKSYYNIDIFYKLQYIENNELSLNSIYSITSPALMKLKEYKEADIIHIHQFHNTKLSLYSLLKMSREKKVVISLHDPWFLTGRCVHFYDCDKWKSGCNNCKKLNTLFPFKIDNCNKLWKLKKNIFNNINVTLVLSSNWMENIVKESPILKELNYYKIPLKVDTEKFKHTDKIIARKKFKIPNENIVLFARAQTEFKGAKYILEALTNIKSKHQITLITCDQLGLFKNLKNKIDIIDLGVIDEATIIEVFSACDIFLMPSTAESFGMMAVEAMSCEIPVIVFDNTALPSVTFAPKCGYLVKDKSSEDLRRAIENLINNPKERNQRGKLGRKICIKYYNKQLYNDNMLKMYKEIKNLPLETKKKYLDGPLSSKEIKQLHFQFNEISKKLFGSSSKRFKNIRFSDSENYNIKLDYNNLNVERYIDDYNEKLYNEIIIKDLPELKYRIKEVMKKFPKFYNFVRNILKH